MKIIKKFKKYSKRININILEKEVGLNLVDKILVVKGPLGEIKSILKNQYRGDALFVKKEQLEYLENTIKKLIHSVYVGWQIEVDLNGVGYKAFTLDNNKLALDLGYSNLITYKNTSLLSLKNYKNKIILFSTNLEYLKDVAFQIRCYAKPDPYKGKGIIYTNEVLKLKKKK